MTRRGPAWSLAIVVSVLAALVGASCAGSTSDRAVDGDPEELEGTATGTRAVQVVGAGKVRLFGTLTVPPAATAGAVPAVLLVPSAGPGDRNGVVGSTGQPDGLAAELARAFNDAGMASYRYDRRGTGESKLEPGTPLTFDDQVADARAALDMLAERRETAGRDLAVVGYDQGGLVALRVAATDSRVKRLVLVSTPGRSVVDIQAAELTALYGPESADALRATVNGLLATRTLPPLDQMRSELRPLLPPQDAAYLAELYGIDPAVDAARVKVPSLLVLPRDPAPYEPARLTTALVRVEVLNAPAAGPTLVITGSAPNDERADPNSAAHEHGSAPPAAEADRDLETVGRIAAFLQNP